MSCSNQPSSTDIGETGRDAAHHHTRIGPDEPRWSGTVFISAMFRRLGCLVAITLVALAFQAIGNVGVASAQPRRCNDGVSSPSDRAQIAALSRVPQQAGTHGGLGVLDDHVERLNQITDILVRHHDRGGLFAVGLAVTERDAVLPLERDPFALQHRQRMIAISLHLLDHYLGALHAHYSGGPVPSHWQHYFTLAAECTVLGQRAAMAGYNAHITVDLAHAVAESAATRADAPDFYRLVDTIAAHAQSIVDVTRTDYGVDLGPAMRFYFLGEGLDRLVGAGRATQPMLRAADVGYNVLTFNNGLALEKPATRAVAANAIDTLWSTGESALTAADRLGVLQLP